MRQSLEQKRILEKLYSREIYKNSKHYWRDFKCLGEFLKRVKKNKPMRIISLLSSVFIVGETGSIAKMIICADIVDFLSNIKYYQDKIIYPELSRYKINKKQQILFFLI